MIFETDNILSKVIVDPIPSRTKKPRATGKSMVIDKGLGVYALEDLLETAGPYIDYIKFGFGTSCLYSTTTLKQKTSLCRLYSVETSTGGTLSEIAIKQKQFERLVATSVEAGFSVIEISDGTYELSATERRDAICCARTYCKVITEVGKKLSAFPDPKLVAEQVLRDLDDGAEMVIMEGRESGENAGIYGATGAVKTDVLMTLLEHLPDHAVKHLMWEAPKKAQQLELIKRFGVNVNLGNVGVTDVIALECLRRGLRADTFAWTLP